MFLFPGTELKMNMRRSEISVFTQNRVWKLEYTRNLLYFKKNWGQHAFAVNPGLTHFFTSEELNELLLFILWLKPCMLGRKISKIEGAISHFSENSSVLDHPGLTRVSSIWFLLFEIKRVLVYTLTIFKLTDFFILYFFIQNIYAYKKVFKKKG